MLSDPFALRSPEGASRSAGRSRPSFVPVHPSTGSGRTDFPDTVRAEEARYAPSRSAACSVHPSTGSGRTDLSGTVRAEEPRRGVSKRGAPPSILLPVRPSTGSGRTDFLTQPFRSVRAEEAGTAVSKRGASRSSFFPFILRQAQDERTFLTPFALRSPEGASRSAACSVRPSTGSGRTEMLSDPFALGGGVSPVPKRGTFPSGLCPRSSFDRLRTNGLS